MTTINDPREIEILLVEDNPGDVRLTEEVLKKVDIDNRLNVVNDGSDALDYLNRTGIYFDRPAPDMILLDLNLPRLSGRELLAIMEKDPRLATIPVVLMTSQFQAEQIQRDNIEIHGRITKPSNMDQFNEAVRLLSEYITAA